MKKIYKALICFALIVCSLFAFSACGSINWSKTTNDTTKISNNGGVLVVRDGYMYFINGTKTNNGTGNKGDVVQSAIYRVAVDADGKIADNAKYEKVVNNLVGFDNGSVFAFGDFIYYTTPCNDVNKSGEVLFNKTEFRRYDLKNKESQLIYTTTVSEEDFEFSYYKQGNGLYLLVYEAGETKTLKSIKIDTEMKTIFTKKNIKSAMFAENGGTQSGANSYVYYTLDADQNSEYTSGVRVYKVLPDGKDLQKISEGENVSLLTVRGNKLIYSLDSYVYFSEITTGALTLKFETTNIVTYNTYDDIIFNDDLSVIVMDNNVLRKIKYESGKKVTDVKIYTYDENKSVEFIGISGDNLIYTISNVVYKINVVESSVKPIQISKTSLEKGEEGTRMIPEIVGNYLYGFCKDSDSKMVYMYKFDLTVDTAKDAERIGVAE